MCACVFFLAELMVDRSGRKGLTFVIKPCFSVSGAWVNALRAVCERCLEYALNREYVLASA